MSLTAFGIENRLCPKCKLASVPSAVVTEYPFPNEQQPTYVYHDCVCCGHSVSIGGYMVTSKEVHRAVLTAARTKMDTLYPAPLP